MCSSYAYLFRSRFNRSFLILTALARARLLFACVGVVPCRETVFMLKDLIYFSLFMLFLAVVMMVDFLTSLGEF
jgi:hypothetical protein